jgi:hypothetical protein
LSEYHAELLALKIQKIFDLDQKNFRQT